MSAYLVNPEHIGVLAAYAAVVDCVLPAWRAGGLIPTAQNVAKGLALENIRSVAHRYPEDKDGERPGPYLKDAAFVEACQIYAGCFVCNDTARNLEPIQVLKLVQCFDYQCCETPGWESTGAARHIAWITSHAVSRLPGYEDAPWGFVSEQLPEVLALYKEAK